LEDPNNLDQQQPKRSINLALWSRFAGLFLLIGAISFGAGWLGSEVNNNRQTTTMDLDQAQQVVTEQSQLISNIAENVGPSVVSVNVVTQGVTRSTIFGQQQFEQQSAGTGFIISDSGYVVTNRHVIDGASKVSVTLSNGTELTDVSIVGSTDSLDPLDLGFLKINDTKNNELKPATIGDSSEVKVGDMVIALGNALGQFQNTVTSGILSGYGRNLSLGQNGDTLQNLFQTDAAINAGNSGGPLVNANGEVIGINTAVAGGAENIGFSIPINDARGLINSVLEEGKLLKPYLGVRYVMLTDDYAFQNNLEVTRGAYIVPSSEQGASIIKDSPADKAGIKEKDVIISVNGITLDERNSLVSVLGLQKVGDEIDVVINRAGEEQTIKVKLEAASTQ